jgi:hypothetical protein
MRYRREFRALSPKRPRRPAQDLHLHVRAQPAVIAQRQAGLLGQRGVRPDPEAQDDHISRDRAVGGQH